MQTLEFKTNIKCGGCIAAVTPHLNALSEIESWKVDTDQADKLLQITAQDQLTAAQVIATLDKAGYKAEQV